MDINRRHFIFGSAAAMTLAGCSTARTGVRPLKPGEKRSLAMIGCGLQMCHLIREFLNPKNAPNVKIVAVCDCDRSRAAGCAEMVNKKYGNKDCRIVYDFQEIVRDPAIDMVCIATPDHWHAYIAVEAMKHGKDVYCEKPLTYSVQETKELMEAARKYGRVFQTGSMQRSSHEFRVAVSLVRGGLIGSVRHVDANFGTLNHKCGGPSHPVRFWDDPNNAAKEGAPNPDIDWVRWLGPARMRPYSDMLAPRGMHRFFPLFWRCDDDLASGYCGDWGAHHLDIAQWGLDMDKSGPYKVIRSDEPYSTNLLHGGRRQFGVRMLFRKPYGDVELYHGPFSHFPGSQHGWGTVFYGDDGIVAVNRGKIAVWVGTGPVKPTLEIRRKIEKCEFMADKIVATSIGKGRKLNPTLDFQEKKYAETIKGAGLYCSNQHVRNFCDCVETREHPITSAEVGGRACTLCHLANMSYKHDTGFDWDPEKMEFANGTGRGIPLSRPGDGNGWVVKA